MIKSNYPGSVDLFTKRLVVSMYGLVTFDLKIGCEVRRLWRRVAVGSVDHPYIMYGCVFLYK